MAEHAGGEETVAVVEPEGEEEEVNYADAGGTQCVWLVDASGALRLREGAEEAPPAAQLRFVARDGTLRLELGVEAWHSALPREGLGEILGRVRRLARRAGVPVTFGEAVAVPAAHQGAGDAAAYVLDRCAAAFDDSLPGLRSAAALGIQRLRRGASGEALDCMVSHCSECPALSSAARGVHAVLFHCFFAAPAAEPAARLTQVEGTHVVGGRPVSGVMQARLRRAEQGFDAAAFQAAAGGLGGVAPGDVEVLQAAAPEAGGVVVAFRFRGAEAAAAAERCLAACRAAEAGAGPVAEASTEPLPHIVAFSALIFLEAPGKVVLQSCERLEWWDSATGKGRAAEGCVEVRYTRAQLCALPLLAALGTELRAGLVLGLGAGTAARACKQAHPAARIVGVELEPAVAAMAQDICGLSGVEVRVADAQEFVADEAARGKQYEVVFCDAYGGGAELAGSVAADRAAFYGACRGIIPRGGVLAANIVLPPREELSDEQLPAALGGELGALRGAFAGLPCYRLRLHSRQFIALVVCNAESRPLPASEFEAAVADYTRAKGMWAGSIEGVCGCDFDASIL